MQPLCPACLKQPQLAVAVLHARAGALDAAYAQLVQVGRVKEHATTRVLEVRTLCLVG